MGAEVLSDPSATAPLPTAMSVSEAYDAVLELCYEDKLYVINWQTAPCMCGCGYEGIVNRFSRKLDAEAWIVAREVDEHGQFIRQADYVVCAITIPHHCGSDRFEVERRLRSELEAMQAVPA